MAVGIAEKDLRCAIWTRFSGREISADFFEVAFPWIEIIDSQSEMVIFVARKEGRAKVSYEMQFLVCTKAEPCAGKSKCRSRNGFEF